MTTIYHNRGKSPRLRRVLALCAVVLVLGCLGYFFRGGISIGTTHVLAGAWSSSDGFMGWFGRIPVYFRGMHALMEERDALVEELRASQLSVLDRNLLYEENLSLKETLDRSVEPNALLASVLARPPEVPYDTLIIDVGEAAGVAVGNKVAAQGTLRIGEIEAVFNTTARVRLYSAPGSSYDAFLRNDIPIRVEGIGGGSLRATVPSSATPAVGDGVSLPGVEANLSFIIEHIEAGRGDSASVVYMRLPISFFTLRHVEVWRTEHEN